MSFDPVIIFVTNSFLLSKLISKMVTTNNFNFRLLKLVVNEKFS